MEDEVMNDTLWRRDNTKIFLAFCLVLITLLVGCSGESGAKFIVNGYLNAIRNGKDTYPYADYRVNDFINVLDFKFLNVESSRVVDHIETINQESYDFSYKTGYTSLAETIKSFKQVYGEKAIISETADKLVIKVAGLQEYILLYDVTHTNVAGQKLYGKFRFVVRQKLFEKTYEIVEWHK